MNQPAAKKYFSSFITLKKLYSEYIIFKPNHFNHTKLNLNY